MKTFVVGDIHGRCAQLLNLLDMLPRDESEDTLVFLGDLIDRGADASGLRRTRKNSLQTKSGTRDLLKRKSSANCSWIFSMVREPCG